MTHAFAAFDLDGRTAVVTGAGGGLGRSAARTLAGAGARVVCGDLDAASAAETAQLVKEQGGEALAAVVDVQDRESVEALFQHAVDAWGRLDIAFNSAGIIGHTPAMEISVEEYTRILSVNLTGTLLSCQAAARRMRPGASIVNATSTVVDAPGSPTLVAYGSSKAGVVQVTRVFARELGPQGIRVNAVAPGWVESKMTRYAFTDEDGTVDESRREKFLATMAQVSPLDLVATPEDIAHAVWFLASDAARFVTGQVMRVNGGVSMA